MPRITTLECPGCPPLRALTFDLLGLIKVVESRGDRGIAQVVERWGSPDSTKCVLAASIDDRKQDPLLAVARKNGTVELVNPLNGETKFSISNAGVDTEVQPEDDNIVGLHLFRKHRQSSSCNLLTCTSKGDANLWSVQFANSSSDNTSIGDSRTWKIGSSGHFLCSKVDGSETYAVFGGKGIEVNLWDLEKCSKIWTAKPPPKNSLGIFTPTWFTSVTFLADDDHRKFAAGTNNHQVRLYDISAQRRPVISFDFRETPIKAITEDRDGHTIYIGNGSGDIASVDMRTGKLLGCFLGKCSGSIRSMAKHPEFPVIASCGLDSYLRLWDVRTRQLLSVVFLKQHLTNVVLDCNFDGKEVVEAQNVKDVQIEDETVALPVKRKKTPKEKERSKKKAAKDSERSNKLRSKKKSRSLESQIDDDSLIGLHF